MSRSLSPFSFSFIIIIYSFRVFNISVSWWSFTEVWVTASLLKSPGLFSVFWPFSIMLSFGWSPLARQLPSHPVPLRNPLVIVIYYYYYYYYYYIGKVTWRYNYEKWLLSFVSWNHLIANEKKQTSALRNSVGVDIPKHQWTNQPTFSLHPVALANNDPGKWCLPILVWRCLVVVNISSSDWMWYDATKRFKRAEALPW